MYQIHKNHHIPQITRHQTTKIWVHNGFGQNISFHLKLSLKKMIAFTFNHERLTFTFLVGILPYSILLLDKIPIKKVKVGFRVAVGSQHFP